MTSTLLLSDPLLARYLKGDFLVRASERMSDQTLYLDHCVEVELALLTVLAQRGFLEPALVKETRQSCSLITPQEIQAEEERVRHDLKAVVNCMARHAPEPVKPLIHLGATSYDILSNAHVMRLREGVRDFVLPSLREVASELARLAEQEAKTPAIGRTHGQFAEPISFGYCMAVFLDRLGLEMVALEESLTRLQGKFSGAVGAYVALGLLFDEPRQLEREILALVELEPNLTSTQITHPEPALTVLHHLVSIFGVLANLADDLRHLQRSEIAEVAESYKAESQVGSSAMPHKQNPITWENIKSLWKTFLPNIMTYYMDQISEHQRDLTNSASARFLPRLLLGLLVAARRASRGLAGLVVERQRMADRLASLEKVVSGPAQVLLSSVGCPDAHEHMRRLALEEGALAPKLQHHPVVKTYLTKLTEEQRRALHEPHRMTGPAALAALETAASWRQRLNLG